MKTKKVKYVADRTYQVGGNAPDKTRVVLSNPAGKRNFDLNVPFGAKRTGAKSVTYPGDTLTNNQLKVALAQQLSSANPLDDENKVIANGLDFQGKPINNLSSAESTHSMLYNLSPIDKEKLMKMKEQMSWYDRFGSYFNNTPYALPKPAYQNGGMAQNGADNNNPYGWINTNQDIQGNPTPKQPERYTKDKDGNLIDNLTGEKVFLNDKSQMSQDKVDALTTQNRLEFTPTGQYDMSQGFKIANGVIDATTAIANQFHTWEHNRQEKSKYLESIQPRAYENKDEAGLNNIPVYFKNGGDNWIPNNLHKGRCSDMGGPDCPKGSPQYNLAMTFKKHHGFHKMQNGGQDNPITAEAGEVYQDNDGAINKISDQADTHDDKSGGVVINNASKVLEDTGDKRDNIDSKLLLIKPQEMLDMSGMKVNKPITHSKAYELMNKKAAKDTKFITKFLKKNTDSLKDSPNDIYAKNSLNLNVNALGTVPTQNDIFQTLFTHQEGKKQAYNINDSGKAQNGKDNDPEVKKLNYLKQQASRQAIGNDTDDPNVDYEAAYNEYLSKVSKNVLQSIGDPTPEPKVDLRELNYLKSQASRQAIGNETDDPNVDYDAAYNEYLSKVSKNVLGNGDPNQAAYANFSDPNPLYGDDVFNSAGYNTTFPKGVDNYGKDMKVPGIQHKRSSGTYGTRDWDMNDFFNRHEWVKQERPNFDPKNPDDVKWFQEAYNKRSNEYFGQPYFNGQGHRKVDSKFGQGTWSTPDVTPQPGTTSTGQGTPTNTTDTTTSRNFNFKQPDNGFNAPLKWYDTAPATYSFIDALNRKAVNYDGVDLVTPKAKYLNPLPTLQQGQADYNTALDMLPQNGQGMANATSLFGKKYDLNDKVLGTYDNLNNGIWNNNEAQTVGIRNQQSQLDFQARQMFEQKQLQSMENQRQQIFQSIKDLTGTVAQNAKYNREGNLLMKLFPAFNQKGDYSGYKYNFQKPNPFAVPVVVPPKKKKS